MSSVLLDALLYRNIQIGLAAAVLIFSAVVIVSLRIRGRKSPEELERARRLQVTHAGRVADGLVVELRDNVVFYTYKVRGIEYEAAQEITHLRHLLPAQEHRLIGAVNLKYIQDNPANSIVIGEEWCGLRVSPPVAALD
jgi:hypothetical protein